MKSLILPLLFICSFGFAQVTVTPAFPTADEEITITYDATQGTSALLGSSKVFMHSGVILNSPSGTGWQNVKGDWGNPGSIGEMTSLGSNKWQIKLTPRSYYGVNAGESIFRIGMVFRSAGPCGGFAGNSTPCKEGKSSSNSDIFIDLYEGDQLQMNLTSPSQFPLFLDQDDQLTIAASISEVSDVSITINGVEVLSEAGVTSVMYDHTVSESPGTTEVLIVADNGIQIKEKLFVFVVRSVVTSSPRPTGILDGINYNVDATKVTLSVWAPLKTSVYVIGDFTNWEVNPNYLMKKDGEHFWLELENLTPGKEYGYQYLIDESFYIADPYSDKILDPDDQYIPAETYPNLKEYPLMALRDQWYFNRVSVFQTGQSPFSWKVEEFNKPKKEELVIYELLIRDFFINGERNYQNLIDTLSYLQRLGINAIELMPITEFNGNESWGYNPTFMFAPDKYYGTKNKLKEFIDECHVRGIAVILDVVMNQQDLPNPYVLMYYDFNNGRPTAENPWFNQQATHPFNVFFDMNHESLYTQKYLDTVNHYWIKEFKFDGYRFDLSKGFTQRDAGGNVSTWGQYDDSRIEILKRMADKIWEHSPDAYVILEHFADNIEEKELAEYRAGEGKGMMLWGNYNHAYNQNTQGNAGADFSGIYHGSRNWTVPHLIGYMESHDEERLMFRNLQSGKSSGSYDVRNLSIAIDRIKAASTLFYTLPGPKMLWQFGELGYDQSINRCEDGSINDGCRVSPKPVLWEYRGHEERYGLYSHISELLELRKNHNVFREGSTTIASGSSLVKQIGIKNTPYTSHPVDATEMNVQMVANFDVTSKEVSINFPHTGVWHEYFTKESLPVSSSNHTVVLLPGEYRLYTDYSLHGNGLVTSVNSEFLFAGLFYPNPVDDRITILYESVTSVGFYTVAGEKLNLPPASGNTFDLSSLSSGLYIVELVGHNGVRKTKIVKR